jgi:nucleoid DNA-binding protein
MKKPDIAKSMARQLSVSHAEAADRLDSLVHRILSDLRRGKETALPGLGSFTSGAGGAIVFRPDERRRHG